MTWLIGHERCNACGYTAMVISRKPPLAGDLGECSECGAPLPRVPVWWPATRWPEALALVQFDEAREALGLGLLDRGEWQ